MFDESSISEFISDSLILAFFYCVDKLSSLSPVITLFELMPITFATLLRMFIWQTRDLKLFTASSISLVYSLTKRSCLTISCSISGNTWLG